jgi:drug/metabolite transporter (DMT)-like permease
MGRKSGYVDGLVSGATWGVVATLLPGADQLSGASLLAISVAVAALCDTAAAFFLLVRSGAAGSLADVARVLASRRALAIGACSVLGGPLFMGGYIAAVILAGPSDALTATATYPVIGAILARFLLRQQLDRVGWLGVTVTVVGATLIAVDASGSDNGVHVLVGVGVALAAAVTVALEGIVATRAMAGLDTNTVMAVQKLLSAIMFGLVLLVIPGGIATVVGVMANAGLIVPIVCAGMIAGYSYVVWYRSIRKIGVARAMALNISYAMWGVVFAWSLHHAPPTLFALTGCVVVTAGAVLTILSGRDESTCAALTSAGPLLASTAAPETLSTSWDPKIPVNPVDNVLSPPDVVDIDCAAARPDHGNGLAGRPV